MLHIFVDAGVMKGGLFSDEYREELVANYFARKVALSLEKEIVLCYNRAYIEVNCLPK